MKNIYILLVLLLVACGTKNETHEEGHEDEVGSVELTDAQFKRAGIVFGKVETKNMSATISVNGVLDVPPQSLVSISAMMGGFIKSTDLLQGMHVKKGQVLATLQNPDFIQIQREYLENKSKLTFLELEYKRQEELSKENVAASKTFQQVTSEYRSVQTAVAALEARLSMLNIDAKSLSQDNIRSVVNIYSPIDGFVTTVNVNIGKYVAPQDVICEVVNIHYLHAELSVFEKDVMNIKKGQKVRFVLVNESSKERMGTIHLIDHVISPERTVRVHVHFDQADESLLPGMYIRALIETENNKTTVVPDEAVVMSGEKQFIYIHDPEHIEHVEKKDTSGKMKHDHAFMSVEVIKGVSSNGFTAISLPEDFDVEKSEVVIKGAYDLYSKMNNSEEEGHGH